MDGLDTLKAKYLTAVAGAADEAALEEVRVGALGKKGEISLKMRDLGAMPQAGCLVAWAIGLPQGQAALSPHSSQRRSAGSSIDAILAS